MLITLKNAVIDIEMNERMLIRFNPLSLESGWKANLVGTSNTSPFIISRKKNKFMNNKPLTPELPVRIGNTITFMGKVIALILPTSRMYDKGSKSS